MLAGDRGLCCVVVACFLGSTAKGLRLNPNGKSKLFSALPPHKYLSYEQAYKEMRRRREERATTAHSTRTLSLCGCCDIALKPPATSAPHLKKQINIDSLFSTTNAARTPTARATVGRTGVCSRAARSHAQQKVGISKSFFF